jgi:competence protein ComEC
LLEYLTSRNIRVLDLVLISHADEDHIAGLIAVFASDLFEVKCVRLNTDSLKGSAIWDDLAEELSVRQRKGVMDFRPSLTDADNGAFDLAEVKIEIIGPTTYLATKGPGSQDFYSRKITTNSISAIIRLHYKDEAEVLLAGDMDNIALDEVKRVGRAMEARNLVFPHHGGRIGGNLVTFSRGLFDLVAPAQVFFSIGRGLYGTPLPDVIAQARARQGLYIACTQLSERCAAASPHGVAQHIGSVFSAGRQSNSCCAGSVVISLADGSITEPQQEAHQDFITNNAKTALCRN